MEEIRLFTLKETAEILGVSYNHLVNSIVASGQLKTIKINQGKKIIHRVTTEAIQNYRNARIPNEKITIENAISNLQEIRNSLLISFVTSQENPIMQGDALWIADVIDNLLKKKQIEGKIPKLDLFINSYGGSIDEAYKIARLLRYYAKEVNVLVPTYAKSAATLICCGADQIVMTPVAELGPVDPIIVNPINPRENFPARAIKIYLSYASDKVRLQQDKIDPAIIGQLKDTLTPQLVGTYFNIINTSKEYLKILLEQLMFKNKSAEGIVDQMVENLTEAHSSHGFVIDIAEARAIGLNVRETNPEEKEAIKRLYVLYSQFMKFNNLSKLVGNEYLQMHQSSQQKNENQSRGGDGNGQSAMYK